MCRLIIKSLGDDEKDSFMNCWSKAAYVNQQGGVESENLRGIGTIYLMSCLTSDTDIPLLDGTSPTILELTNRQEFFVYSYDIVNRKVVIRG